MRTLLANCTIENLAVVTVDCHIRPINHAIISRGTIDQAFYSPAELIRIAILSNAAGILVYHNHPSDVLTPLQEVLPGKHLPEVRFSHMQRLKFRSETTGATVQKMLCSFPMIRLLRMAGVPMAIQNTSLTS